jgi:hypothetical protein
VPVTVARQHAEDGYVLRINRRGQRRAFLCLPLSLQRRPKQHVTPSLIQRLTGRRVDAGVLDGFGQLPVGIDDESGVDGWDAVGRLGGAGGCDEAAPLRANLIQPFLIVWVGC